MKSVKSVQSVVPNSFRVTRCEVAGVRYVHVPVKWKRGKLMCQGCTAYDTARLEMSPLCDELPECAGGIWKRQQQPQKGSKIVPIRIPADLLTQLDAQVKRIPAATRSSIILAAIAEKCNTPAANAKRKCNTK